MLEKKSFSEQLVYRWRHIIWGHSIQFVFALIALRFGNQLLILHFFYKLLRLIFRWDLGNQIVRCLSSKVSTFLNYTYQGADFVFAYLATGKPFIPEAFNRTGELELTETVQSVLRDINDMGVVPAPFFFGPLSIIYFVSFFVSMLYYWGTLQFIVKKIGEDKDHSSPDSEKKLLKN